VIGVVGGPEKAAVARKLGAEVVVADGAVRPSVSGRLRLEEAADGLQQLADSATGRRVVYDAGAGR